jgi:hypothetical protein
MSNVTFEASNAQYYALEKAKAIFGRRWSEWCGRCYRWLTDFGGDWQPPIAPS